MNEADPPDVAGPLAAPEDTSPRDARTTVEGRSPAPSVTPAEVDRLLHELGVHQIELEMQNDELRRAQAALTAARDRYVDPYEYAPVGYVTLDGDGIILAANRLALTLLGQPSHRLVGRRLAEFITLPERARFQQRIARMHSGGVAGTQELTLVPDAGGRFSRVAVSMSLLIADGERPQCRVALLDVTERAAMQRDAGRLAAIVASSEDAIVGRGLDGVVMSWNEAAERMFGVTAGEMIGRPLDRFVPPERRAEEHGILRRVRAGEKLPSFETERCHRDGSRVHVSMSVSPIRDESGRVTGSALIARDIGERKRAERALHKRLRQLDVLSQVGQVLIMGDQASASVRNELFQRVRLAIGSEVCVTYRLGPEPGTLQLAFEHGLPEACRAGMAQLATHGSLAGAAAARRSPLIVEDLRASEMAEAPLLCQAGLCCYAGFPLVANGQVFGVAAFAWADVERFRIGDLQLIQTVCDQIAAMLERARLVDELHARQRSLEDADRRKDDFIATLAHELRNPLAPIRNALAILRGDGLPEAQRRWCRDVMERQVAQMTRLLEDLLDVSRVTRNRIALRRDYLDLRTVVDEAVETTRPLIEAQRHHLSVDVPEERIVLHGDLARLTQVLANLLNNAAKYTDPGGRIELAAWRDDAGVSISVRDSGIGIEEGHLASVFEMFSQLTPALERSRGGLGIGLSLSQALIELHGGRLEARSEGRGLGSEFLIRLPVVRRAGDPVPGARTPAPVEMPVEQQPHARGQRVLVVDDNADAAQTLSVMLRLQGLQVRTAFGGEEGMDLAGQWHPDVAVIDIGMPELNGYELCRRLRAQPWGARMTLIACTGWGQDEDRQRARDAGFDHHLVKPIETGAVLALLSRDG